MYFDKIISLLLCSVLLLSCSKAEGDPDIPEPNVRMTVESSASTSVTLEVKSLNADHVRILCHATADTKSQTAESVVANGTKYTDSKITIEELLPQTKYTVFAVACTDQGTRGKMEYIQFTTTEAGPAMYPWEQQRNGVPAFSDMVLCYGGSRHRSPYLWEKERLEPFVTYVDTQGKEHWMFDGFLCLEFVSASRPDRQSYAFEVGHKGYTSAGKAQWTELIDYWFENGNGINALEQAVGPAAQRIGAPPEKRKVIMGMPDAVIFKIYDDLKSSTTYWGELNGVTLDFSKSADRISAFKWYIDEVRKRFDRANFRHIELAGFYIISEELVSPDDGWAYELKRSDEVIPSVAKYLHAINESLSWIPYNRSAGYKRWERFGVDYAYMQPNYFWDNAGKYPLNQYFANIKVYNLAMEFEFDDALLAESAGSETYRTRFREYMSNAKASGTYGTKPLSYYQGENSLYKLSKSSNALDRELYHEFGEFVINNPLRSQQ